MKRIKMDGIMKKLLFTLLLAAPLALAMDAPKKNQKED